VKSAKSAVPIFLLRPQAAMGKSVAKKGVLMTDLLKEMCRFSGKLSDFIYKTKDKEKSQNLLEIFFKVNSLCEKIAKQKFDENDDFYRDTIEKIMDTERLIKEFKANQIKRINVFVHIIDIIANVEKIILGWKTSNGK
jgi:hypothetical protein